MKKRVKNDLKGSRCKRTAKRLTKEVELLKITISSREEKITDARKTILKSLQRDADFCLV